MQLRQTIIVIQLLKDIVIRPRRLFEQISNGKLSREVYITFGLGAFITFSKTFALKQHEINFFNNYHLNQILSLLSNPQIKWVLLYIFYFLFLFLIFSLCKFFFKQAKWKPLLLSLMSISGIGVISQILFFLFNFIFPKNLSAILSYLIFLWVAFLSVWAIKYSQNLPVTKSIILFLISALPIIFIIRLVGISPYLAWINISL